MSAIRASCTATIGSLRSVLSTHSLYRRKSIELCISVILFVVALTQMIVHICQEVEDRCSIKSKYIIMTSMILSLLSKWCVK
jgi:hypothetical protein